MNTNKKRNKFVALLLAMIMVLTMVPGMAFAGVKNAEDEPSSYGYDESAADSVKVYVTLSSDGMPLKGNDAGQTAMAYHEIEVPYFDLSDYGLEGYYRYETDGGSGSYVNEKVVKRPTVLHLYIYMTERYYMGLDEDQCGQGTSGVMDYIDTSDVMFIDGDTAYAPDGSKTAFGIDGGACSLYINGGFWGHDENLNYYRNHRYPLMTDGIGATADYALLSDGDVIDVALNSDWNNIFFGNFLSFNRDDYEGDAGETLTVSTKSTSRSATFGEETPILDYTDELDVALYDAEWNNTEAEVTSNGDGTYSIVLPEEGGKYYLLGTSTVAKTSDCVDAPAVAAVTVAEKAAEPVRETVIPLSISRTPDFTGLKVEGVEVKGNSGWSFARNYTQNSINIYVAEADKNNTVTLMLETKEGSVYSGPLVNTADTLTLSEGSGTYTASRVMGGTGGMAPRMTFTINFSLACTNPDGDAHTYGAGVVTTEPTCFKEGVKTFTCTCGATKTEAVATVAHTWDEGTVTTEPTCTEKGVKTFACTVEGCDGTKTENVAALGHDWNDGKETKAATCGKDGIKTFICKRDGCKEVKTTDIPATGEHNWDDGKITTKPTCVDGVKTFTCSSCKATKTEAVSATKEHTWDDGVETKAPGYYYEGQTTYTCKVCDDIKTEAIPVIEEPVFITEAYYLDEQGEKHQVDYTVDYDVKVPVYDLGGNATWYRAPLHTFSVPHGANVEKMYFEATDICNAVNGSNTYVIEEDGKWTNIWEGHSYSADGTARVLSGIDNLTGTVKIVSIGDLNNNYMPAYTFKFDVVHTWDEGTVTKAATDKEDGEKTFKCTGFDCEEITTEPIAKISSAKLSAASYTYNGKVKAPSVTVKDSEGNVLTKGEDYKVTYDKGRKSVGQYKVKVTYTGDYAGTKTLTFKIVPAATKVTSLKADKKAMTVKWSKKTTQTTGYQIKYATNKNFNNAKYKLVKSNKTTKAKISKLTSKKTYYVAVRTYKNVKVDGKTVKIYSSWSKAKSVKVK